MDQRDLSPICGSTNPRDWASDPSGLYSAQAPSQEMLSEEVSAQGPVVDSSDDNGEDAEMTANPTNSDGPPESGSSSAVASSSMPFAQQSPSLAGSHGRFGDHASGSSSQIRIQPILISDEPSTKRPSTDMLRAGESKKARDGQPATSDKTSGQMSEDSGAEAGPSKNKGKGKAKLKGKGGPGKSKSNSQASASRAGNLDEPKLACPYFQRNRNGPRLERSCKGPGFPSIPRLKEHLYRRHMCHVCDRCDEWFPSREEAQKHTGECTGSRPSGQQDISPEYGFREGGSEEKQLRAKKRNMTWRDVYLILFPEEKTLIPSSTYSDEIHDHIRNYHFHLVRHVTARLPAALDAYFAGSTPDVMQKLKNGVPEIFNSLMLEAGGFNQGQTQQHVNDFQLCSFPPLESQMPAHHQQGHSQGQLTTLQHPAAMHTHPHPQPQPHSHSHSHPHPLPHPHPHPQPQPQPSGSGYGMWPSRVQDSYQGGAHATMNFSIDPPPQQPGSSNLGFIGSMHGDINEYAPPGAWIVPPRSQ